MKLLGMIILDTFSKHFKIALCALLTISLCLFLTYHSLKARIEKVIPGLALKPSPPVLPSNDREEIMFNSATNKLTIITPTKTTVSYDRNPKIEIRKNGTVVVSKREFGTEFNPWMGLGYSLGEGGRGFMGLNGLYAYRFDLGLALSLNDGNASKASVKTALLIGYNFWRHTSIVGGLDNSKRPTILFNVIF